MALTFCNVPKNIHVTGTKSGIGQKTDGLMCCIMNIMNKLLWFIKLHVKEIKGITL